MVRLAENKVLGTFNAMGPAKPTTMAEVLYGIKAVTTAGASFTWLPNDFLASNGVRGWRHMPIWLPPAGPTAGFLRRNNSKALAAGLTFRPLAVTAKDTLDWHKTRPEEEQKATLEGAVAGISPAKEAEVLAAWKAKG
jgi:2'-hydroxyisoflavone reductase